MPELSIVVPHALDQSEVVARLKKESEVLRGSFSDRVTDVEEVWEDHTLRFRFAVFGMLVDGQVTVEPTQVSTSADVPLAAMAFRSTIEQKIRSRLEELLKPQV